MSRRSATLWAANGQQTSESWPLEPRGLATRREAQARKNRANTRQSSVIVGIPGAACHAVGHGFDSRRPLNRRTSLLVVPQQMEGGGAHSLRGRCQRVEDAETVEDAATAAKDLLRKRVQETFHPSLITLARAASEPHQHWVSGNRRNRNEIGATGRFGFASRRSPVRSRYAP
jgi:hypothetical protein